MPRDHAGKRRIWRRRLDRGPRHRSRAASEYLLLGLDRAVRTQFKEEESLVCPLLESDVGSGPTWASSLRTKHLRILGEMASLTTGGVQDAVTLARRLHALTNTLLDDLREQEETLWSGGGLRVGGVQLGRA